MRRNSGSHKEGVPMRHMSRLGESANDADLLGISATSRGQSCPQDCPHQAEMAIAHEMLPLGEALDIEEVALLLGCSAWTIRQKYLPQGLPYLRASANGKFVFFRRQVIDWILKRQTRGGTK